MRIKNKMELRKELTNAEGTTGIYKYLYIFDDGTWEIREANIYPKTWSRKIMFVLADRELCENNFSKLFKMLEQELNEFYNK